MHSASSARLFEHGDAGGAPFGRPFFYSSPREFLRAFASPRPRNDSRPAPSSSRQRAGRPSPSQIRILTEAARIVLRALRFLGAPIRARRRRWGPLRPPLLVLFSAVNFSAPSRLRVREMTRGPLRLPRVSAPGGIALPNQDSHRGGEDRSPCTPLPRRAYSSTATLVGPASAAPSSTLLRVNFSAPSRLRVREMTRGPLRLPRVSAPGGIALPNQDSHRGGEDRSPCTPLPRRAYSSTATLVGARFGRPFFYSSPREFLRAFASPRPRNDSRPAPSSSRQRAGRPSPSQIRILTEAARIVLRALRFLGAPIRARRRWWGPLRPPLLLLFSA